MGRTLPRERSLDPSYWFDNDTLVCRKAGDYILRVYDDPTPFESAIIQVNPGLVMSKNAEDNAAVAFWPQVMFQGSFGVLRVSGDGRQLAFASQGNKGRVSVGYRLINTFGQVSEPVCIELLVV
jgi:hypothetical protein